MLPGHLSKYKIIEKIGTGSFSTIYVAKNLRTGEKVAIKCVPTNKLKSSCKKLLLSEIELLQSLNHQHIIKCIDHYVSDTFIFIVLEYCMYGDLSYYLDVHILSENEVQKLFCQLISAVQYLQNKKVMHRDIKPSNILLSEDYVLKLSDFGLAKQYQDSSELASTICGSPLYMAPELLHQKKYSTTCDVWSLGIVLYEMLFQKVPFEANTFQELKTNIQKSIRLDSNMNHISAPCRDLLFRILTQKEEERITWVELFRHPWICQTITENVNYNSNNSNNSNTQQSKPCKQSNPISISKKHRSVHEYIVPNFLSSDEDFEFINHSRSYTEDI